MRHLAFWLEALFSLTLRAIRRAVRDALGRGIEMLRNKFHIHDACHENVMNAFRNQRPPDRLKIVTGLRCWEDVRSFETVYVIVVNARHVQAFREKNKWKKIWRFLFFPAKCLQRVLWWGLKQFNACSENREKMNHPCIYYRTHVCIF